MAKLTITIPNWLDRICAWPVTEYRRRKYGYSYRRIYLGEGEWTMLDETDYYKYGNFRWTIGGDGRKLYAVRYAKNGNEMVKTIRLHRVIMNAPAGVLVDHHNGNSLDNRTDNLRLASQFQNNCNRQKTKSKTSSQFIGVHLEKGRNKWISQIWCRGKRIFLGRFDNEIDAARAYDEAAKKYHGEFARLNFPDLPQSHRDTKIS